MDEEGPRGVWEVEKQMGMWQRTLVPHPALPQICCLPRGTGLAMLGTVFLTVQWFLRIWG